MAQYIRVDIFPANVLINGAKQHRMSRAIVTDDAVHIYVDTSSGPAEIYNERLEDFSGNASVGYTATTDNGDTVLISKGSGCGCGSRLKGFRPFPGVQQLPR